MVQANAPVIVQRKDQGKSPTPEQRPGQHVQKKQALRGMSFDEGEKALLPPSEGEEVGAPKGGPVQMRGKKGRKGGGGGGGGSTTSSKGTTTTTTTPPTQETTFQKVTKKLGEVASIDDAFGAIGGLIDMLAPTSGQGFSGQIDVKIKPPLGGGFYLNLNLEGTAKRNTDDKLELEGKIGLVVGAAGNMYMFSGYVGARGMLGVKATADGGYGCLRLMGLGIHSTIAAWTTRGADWLFGGGYEQAVVGGMTPETEGGKADSLEYTGELGVEGGSGGMTGGEEAKAEGKLQTGLRSKTKISKEKSGDTKAKSETENGFMLVLGGKAKAGGLEIEGGGDMFITSGKPIAWELKCEAAADADKLKDPAQIAKNAGDVFGNLVGTYRSCVSNYEKRMGGDKNRWAQARIAVGALSTVPKMTIGHAMHKQGSKAPLGTKAAFEVGLKFEGASLKEFTIEALQKYELPDGAKEALGNVGVELGGKQSTTILSHKSD